MKKKIIFIIFSIIAFLIILFGIIKIITLPPLVKPSKLVEIPENLNASQIAKILYQKKVIKNPSLFLFLTNRLKVQNKLKSGIYEFSGRTPLKKVIEKLVKGEVKLIKVTIPEGKNIVEIADILEKKGLIKNKDDFIKHAKEKKLEGFLFPDTYFFPLKISIEGITYTMWKRFNEVWYDLKGERINDENFDEVKKIVTIASIVEKEATYPEGKKIVAGIIYKRLKKGLPIQSCATVEYAIGQHKQKLNNKDLKVKSPYNTYIHKGLPPTPICNPGKVSLQAALNPKKTDYLFFVSMGNGKNYFSKTYEEHLQAKQIYITSRQERVENETPLFMDLDK